MPEQTPEPLTDARLLQLRDDEYVCTNANERSMAAELIAARERIAEWRGLLAEIVDAVSAPEDTRFDVLPEVVRARIADLERGLEWARTAEANTLDVANRNVTAYALTRADLDAARRWAAWFAAERDQTADYLSQAAEFLQETADECETFRARVAELEAAQGEPDGYVVGWDPSDGEFVVNSTPFPDLESAYVQAGHMSIGNPNLRVFELREVRGA